MYANISGPANLVSWDVRMFSFNSGVECVTLFASRCGDIISHHFHDYIHLYIIRVYFLPHFTAVLPQQHAISSSPVPSLHWHLAVFISTRTKLSPSITMTSSSTNSMGQTLCCPIILEGGLRSRSIANSFSIVKLSALQSPISFISEWYPFPVITYCLTKKL